LRRCRRDETISAVESPIEHRDVTTIMRLLGDIQADVRRIRNLLEDEDGEEEAPEDDA
jgi:phage host-nuclease inhibitor protein Gam